MKRRILVLRYALLLLILFCVPSYAQDPEAIRNFIKENFTEKNFSEQWVDRKGKTIAQSPEIRSWDKENILIDRTNEEGVRDTYKVSIQQVSVPKIEIPLKLKSTTCPNIQSTLNCKFKFQLPLVYAAVHPVSQNGETSPNRQERKFRSPTISFLNAGFEFFKRNFPELGSEIKLDLECNSWDWIEAGDPSFELIETGSVIESAILDLGISAKNQFHASMPQTCPGTHSACNLLENNKGGIESIIPFLVDSFSWYLQVKKESQTCTAEFQAIQTPQVLEALTNPGSFPDERFNDPQYLKTIEQRITPQFIEEWVTLRISGDRSATNLFGNLSVENLYIFSQYPLLRFFELVDSSGSTGSSPEKNQILLSDQFSPEEEN